MSIGKYFTDAIAVASNPSQFYREMPKSGGLVEPALYVLAMAVVAVLLCALGAIFDADTQFFGTLFGHLIPHIVKVFVIVAIATVALYFLWQRLGSSQDFEVSARSVAYLAVFSPIWIVFGGVGGLLGLVLKVVVIAWLVMALVAASTEVHSLDKQSALTSFVGLALLLSLFSYLSNDKIESVISSADDLAMSQLVSGDDTENLSEPFGLVDTQENQTTLDKMLEESAESLRVSSSQAKKHDIASDSIAIKDVLGVEAAVEEGSIVKKDAILDAIGRDSELAEIENSKQVLVLEDDANAEQSVSLETILEPETTSELEAKSQQAGEALGNLVKGFDESVEKVGEQLALAAQDFQQGLNQAEDGVAETVVEGIDESSELAAPIDLKTDLSKTDVTVEVQPEGESSIAESAGAALGTMLEGMGDIVEGVQQGFQKAVEDQAPESSESVPSKSNELMTPEQLGVAMAEFMRGIDQAAEQSAESMEEVSGSAIEALNRFMESYQKALEEGNTE